MIEVKYDDNWQVWLLVDNGVPVGAYDTQQQAYNAMELYTNETPNS